MSDYWKKKKKENHRFSLDGNTDPLCFESVRHWRLPIEPGRKAQCPRRRPGHWLRRPLEWDRGTPVPYYPGLPVTTTASPITGFIPVWYSYPGLSPRTSATS